MPVKIHRRSFKPTLLSSIGGIYSAILYFWRSWRSTPIWRDILFISWVYPCLIFERLLNRSQGRCGNFRVLGLIFSVVYSSLWKIVNETLLPALWQQFANLRQDRWEIDHSEKLSTQMRIKKLSNIDKTWINNRIMMMMMMRVNLIVCIKRIDERWKKC